MIDIGVARPSAHGQAMMRTETAATRAKARRGSGPNSIQAVNASAATSSTSGTNHPATWSARRWMGARERCASATICTMWASMVSRPTFSAFITSPPDARMVPAIRRSPGPLLTGSDSPVTIASSREAWPSITLPSTGTRSPGRTRSVSPTAISSTGASASDPSAPMRRASFGVRSRSARMAPEVLSRAFSSITCPASTSTTITAAASK